MTDKHMVPADTTQFAQEEASAPRDRQRQGADEAVCGLQRGPRRPRVRAWVERVQRMRSAFRERQARASFGRRNVIGWFQPWATFSGPATIEEILDENES